MPVDSSLDRLDLRILETLQADGRITNRDLAERVNLSASACHQRVQRLVKQGWLQGFLGLINIERLCAPVNSIASLSLSNHSPDVFNKLEQIVDAMPEALEAYTVSGESDFIIRFACSTMARYLELTDQLIRECPEVTNISTHIVMRESKRFRGYPLKSFVQSV